MCNAQCTAVITVVAAVLWMWYLASDSPKNITVDVSVGTRFTKALDSVVKKVETMDGNIPGYCRRLLEVEDEIWCLVQLKYFTQIRIYSKKNGMFRRTIETIATRDKYTLHCNIHAIAILKKTIVLACSRCSYLEDGKDTFPFGLFSMNFEGNIHQIIKSGIFRDVIIFDELLYSLEYNTHSGSMFVNVHTNDQGVWGKHYNIKVSEESNVHSLLVTSVCMIIKTGDGFQKHDFAENIKKFTSKFSFQADIEFESQAKRASVQNAILCQTDSDHNILAINQDLNGQIRLYVFTHSVRYEEKRRTLYYDWVVKGKALSSGALYYALIDSDGNLWISRPKQLEKITYKNILDVPL